MEQILYSAPLSSSPLTNTIIDDIPRPTIAAQRCAAVRPSRHGENAAGQGCGLRIRIRLLLCHCRERHQQVSGGGGEAHESVVFPRTDAAAKVTSLGLTPNISTL